MPPFSTTCPPFSTTCWMDLYPRPVIRSVLITVFRLIKSLEDQGGATMFVIVNAEHPISAFSPGRSLMFQVVRWDKNYAAVGALILSYLPCKKLPRAWFAHSQILQIKATAYLMFISQIQQ